MFANIAAISTQEFFENASGHDERFDIFLVDDDDGYDRVQEFLEADNTLVFVTLEEEDLSSKLDLLKAIHGAILEEDTSSDNINDIIEAIEDELGELASCVLGLPIFADCDDKSQAALLELAIVSNAFKLLLHVDKNVFEHNLPLWKVLLKRSVLIEDEDDREYTLVSAEEIYSEAEEQAESEPLEEKLWYQMIPKYHLAIALALILVIAALWKMDVSKTREEVIPIELDKITENQKSDIREQDSLDNRQPHGPSQVIEYSSEETQVVDEPIRQEETAYVEESLKIKSPSPAVNEVEVIEVPVEETVKASVPDGPVPAESQPIKQDVKVIENKPLPVTTKQIKPVDWSPYQSYQWIKNLDSRYFTLQLMASHSEKGIRDFLAEQGVNSQYAVYTIEKDGKPWHVIIYGVYQSRDFADSARQNLPDYLKAYSPWIRPVRDIQSSLP